MTTMIIIIIVFSDTTWSQRRWRRKSLWISPLQSGLLGGSYSTLALVWWWWWWWWCYWPHQTKFYLRGGNPEVLLCPSPWHGLYHHDHAHAHDHDHGIGHACTYSSDRVNSHAHDHTPTHNRYHDYHNQHDHQDNHDHHDNHDHLQVWAGFAMIIVASYTANLAAFLVLDKPQTSNCNDDDDDHEGHIIIKLV